MQKSESDKEYRKVCLEEVDFLVRAAKKKPTALDDIIARYVPDDLEATLNKAFCKAFELILVKGTDIIGATMTYKEDRKAEDAIRKSKIAGIADTALTFAEGAGFGIIGLGLPDIPVYTAMVLRNIYQTAAFYGYDYDSDTEKTYILNLIRGGLAMGSDAEKVSTQVDVLAGEIDELKHSYMGIRDDLIAEAAQALADEMLYLKFVQGIPIVGAVGGFSNAATMRRINKYADIKYHKRSLKRL